jgi:hypothetical protein
MMGRAQDLNVVTVVKLVTIVVRRSGVAPSLDSSGYGGGEQGAGEHIE